MGEVTTGMNLSVNSDERALVNEVAKAHGLSQKAVIMMLVRKEKRELDGAGKSASE